MAQTRNKRKRMLKTGSHWWALTNFGRVIVVLRTKRKCIDFAEAQMMQPWPAIEHIFEVRKVTLTEGWD